MELKNGIPTFHAPTRADWRAWLEKNHATEKSVWLILYNKNSGVPTVNYDEAVEEALCFGWIDGVVNKRDDVSRVQYFTPRKPKSNWSRLNKTRAERLIAEGQMQPAGLNMIELAKETGTWNALDAVEDLIPPDDLRRALEARPGAWENWETLSRSLRRGLLEQLLNTKRAETRERKIADWVEKIATLGAKAFRT